jgi:hypothetical protein
MLTVACVLKSGGIYDATWVARLKAGVARHLPVEHRFVCLSDVAVPCERIPLDHDWPGWWSKIELFRLPGPVLFFDLDTAIVGDLSDIAANSSASRLTMLRDFYAPNHLGSGMMSWGAAAPRRLYDIFVDAPADMMAVQRVRMGDQAYIEEVYSRSYCGLPIARWQDVLPGEIVSYKVHCRSGIPENARVVCLHGKPKFDDMPAGDPVRLAWEMAA